jgi:LPS export ABC transporter protein LptC
MRWLTRLAIAVLFLAAASALWWMDTVREPELEPEPRVETEQLPDYYFTDFRSERYRGDGPPRQILTGERLDHFAADDTADVLQPRVDYRPAGAPQWYISGDRGMLARRTDTLDLDGAVRLYRPPATDVREATLLTPHLRYDMTAEIAHTERPVRMLSPGTRIDAVGMTAWLESERVELHHDVHTRHDPALAATDESDG